MVNYQIYNECIDDCLNCCVKIAWKNVEMWLYEIARDETL